MKSGAVGTPMLQTERPDYDRHVAASCAGLSRETFAAAWAQGRAMTLKQAIEHALD